MSLKITCHHCGEEVSRNVRIKKGQKYCKAKECRKASRRSWKKKKYATDSEYRKKCQDNTKEWQKDQPAYKYQQGYRAKHPDYVKRNRELQRIRYKERKKACNCISSKIVNRNTFAGYPSAGNVYKIIPLQDEKIVNRNTFMARIQLL